LRLDRANWLANSADAWTLGGRRDLTGSSGEFVRNTGPAGGSAFFSTAEALHF
jgi:hypothetical protein